VAVPPTPPRGEVLLPPDEPPAEEFVDLKEAIQAARDAIRDGDTTALAEALESASPEDRALIAEGLREELLVGGAAEDDPVVATLDEALAGTGADAGGADTTEDTTAEEGDGDRTEDPTDPDEPATPPGNGALPDPNAPRIDVPLPPVVAVPQTPTPDTDTDTDPNPPANGAARVTALASDDEPAFGAGAGAEAPTADTTPPEPTETDPDSSQPDLGNGGSPDAGDRDPFDAESTIPEPGSDGEGGGGLTPGQLDEPAAIDDETDDLDG
jgi:hypothetical protein